MLDFNSFSEFGEKTEISYYHTFPNSQNFGQASTEVFVGASGLKGGSMAATARHRSHRQPRPAGL